MNDVNGREADPEERSLRDLKERSRQAVLLEERVPGTLKERSLSLTL